MQTERSIITVEPAPPEPARASVIAAAEDYGVALARSLEATRRHDQLVHRLHAADSARALLRLLFGLEGRRAPDVEDLPEALPQLEAVQDWPAGYLRWALLHLLRDPAPRRQIELARRVERLLASRDVSPAAILEPDASDGVTPRAPWTLRDGRHLRAGPDARSVLE